MGGQAGSGERFLEVLTAVWPPCSSKVSQGRAVLGGHPRVPPLPAARKFYPTTPKTEFSLEPSCFPTHAPKYPCHHARFSGHPRGCPSLCSTDLCPQECPPGAVPFRDLQCALYNGHPVLGTQKTYQWVPFYGGE